jgi:hypothetical protein
VNIYCHSIIRVTHTGQQRKKRHENLQYFFPHRRSIQDYKVTIQKVKGAQSCEAIRRLHVRRIITSLLA